ncbi:MAG: hypothetical protein ACQETB_10610 [Halobacteriota archaeon]
MPVPDNCGESQDGGSAIPCVSALVASPDRTVFTEAGNCDGWIATDVTVDLER